MMSIVVAVAETMTAMAVPATAMAMAVRLVRQLGMMPTIGCAMWSCGLVWWTCSIEYPVWSNYDWRACLLCVLVVAAVAAAVVVAPAFDKSRQPTRIETHLHKLANPRRHQVQHTPGSAGVIEATVMVAVQVVAIPIALLVA
jgi:uncharacterized membrane protein YqjE